MKAFEVLFTHRTGSGKDLVAYVIDDRVVFSGASTGKHSLHRDGDTQRVKAHWKQYIERAKP